MSLDNGKLNPADRASGAWRNVAEYAEARIETLRSQLESEQNTEGKTAVMRGRIAELRALLALGQDRPPAPREN